MKHDEFNATHIREDIGALCECPWVNPEDIINLNKELNQICGKQEQFLIKLRRVIEDRK